MREATQSLLKEQLRYCLNYKSSIRVAIYPFPGTTTDLYYFHADHLGTHPARG